MMENNFNEQLCMLYLSLVFAYHHLFTTVIVAISTSAYVSALHSHLHFFHQARSTCHHHLLETPSSPRKEPTRRLPTYQPSRHHHRDQHHFSAALLVQRQARRTTTTSHLPPSSIADDSPHQVSRFSRRMRQGDGLAAS
ncbi:hypothetical protein Dimus_008254 [Dionaea muscipula]